MFAVLVATAPEDAGACSCAAAPTEERYDKADAAVIGTVVSDDGRRGRIRVEHAFKADLGEELVLPTEGGSDACGLDLEPGDRLGLFLTRDGDGWSAGGCDYVNPDDLPGAAERLPRPLGAGTAALLLSGEFSGGRVAVLDAEGRPIAYGAERGEIAGVSVCPRSQHVVELVARGGAQWIAVRRVRDMRVLREDRAPWPGRASDVACLDPAARFDRKDGEGALVFARLRGARAVRVRPVPDTFLLEATVMWTGADRFLLGGGRRRLELYDDRLRRVRRFASRLEPVLLVRTRERVYGLDGENLHVAEGPDLAVRDLGRIPAPGLSSLTAIPDPVEVATGR